MEVNNRFPVFFSEKRPFFMEGFGLFNLAGTGGDGTMRTAVHTRRIVDPSAGVKLTGTSGAYTFGALVAPDASVGPIAFLAAAIEAGVADDRTRRLLDRAVRWVLAHAVDIGRLSFPSWVRPGMPPKQTRAAWCYGDPGVVSALMRAAQASGNEAHVNAAVEIGTRASLVRFDDTGVKDAGLCHGAAGLAHIYRRLFFASGHPTFEQAACDWIECLLDMRRPGEGIGRFILFGPRRDATPEPSVRGEPPQAVWQPDPTFLTGSAGIGLTLLAATSNVAPEWDRLLLLS